MFKNSLIYCCSLLLILTQISCGDDGQECTFENSDIEVAAYIAAENLQTTRDSSGIHYIIEVEGSAEKPTIDSRVTVNYRGYLTNGDQFDSSYDRGVPATFPLQGVIQGWQIGIPLFGRGGKGTVIVPCYLAYGNAAQGAIPAGAVIAFDVEVIDFTP